MANARVDETFCNFNYIYSCDLETNLKIKVGTLEGILPRPDYEEVIRNPILRFAGRNQSRCPDLMVEVVVMNDGSELHLPVTTAYKYFTNRWAWNQWLVLPIKFCDLPRMALLCLTVFDCNGPGERCAIGGTTVSLFGKKGVFRQGMLDLQVWQGVQADGRIETTTPGKVKDAEKEHYHRLTKLTKKYHAGKIPPVDWLDRLAFSEIERISQKEKQNSNLMYLMIEFPQVISMDLPLSVLYYEKNGDERIAAPAHSDVVKLPDQEILQSNLVEEKHHRLARSHRTGLTERELKPNPEIRNRLTAILAYPTTQVLTGEEQDLIWRYRYYLGNNKKALAKFVKCVNWNVKTETDQAMELVRRWVPMDVQDALELLGPTFKHPALRKYAVTRLAQAQDDDLQLYLLQLVQALKYENFRDILLKVSQTQKPDLIVKSDAGQLSERRVEDCITASRSSSTDGSLPPNTMTISEQNLGDSMYGDPPDVSSGAGCTNQDLASFLVYRACRNSSLANYFYWYLLIECEDMEGGLKQDAQVQEMYKTVLKIFSDALKKGPQEWKERRQFLDRQHRFMNKLVELVKAVMRESGNRKKKIERIQTLLADTETFKFNFGQFDALPLPLDPEVKICGISAEKATLFKSSLMPSRLAFKTVTGEEYVTIFKLGDDLRQDQLVLQIIGLMDQLLRRENLDLRLTPYRVLATSSRHGFVQFVDSTPIADVLSGEGSILNFFRKHNPSETGPYGITADAMDTYVKSCAGYCVITYLLGVGDRHLDNLMLTKSGKLFHIDFGYILGRDPKPLPPPMKLSKEMIEGMGGVSSEHYQDFRKECYTAFLYLRRHANLILNLFSLMVDASVPDIALEPDKTVRKVQDKFRLDLTEEEAVQYIQNLIDISATAIMAVMVERLHQLAQYWRK